MADRAEAPHNSNLFDLPTKSVDAGPSAVVRDELAARAARAVTR